MCKVFNQMAELKEEFCSYHILKICLQPIVENAINHGLSRQSEEGTTVVFLLPADG